MLVQVPAGPLEHNPAPHDGLSVRGADTLQFDFAAVARRQQALKRKLARRAVGQPVSVYRAPGAGAVDELRGARLEGRLAIVGEFQDGVPRDDQHEEQHDGHRDEHGQQHEAATGLA
jgi:hypothetical protein